MTRATNLNFALRTTPAHACRRLAVGLATVAIAMVPAVLSSVASAAAPEGRGYEMVSPPDKNFGDIAVGVYYFGDIAAAGDGEAASFCTTANFGGTSGGTVCGDYLSRRNAAGRRWESTPVSPPYCTIDTTDPSYVWLLKPQFQQTISADMSKVVSLLPEGGGGCPFEPLDPFAPTPSLNLYLFDEVGNPASARLVAPEPGIATTSPLQTYAGEYVAGTPDLSRIVFRSTGQQTSEVPADGQSRLFEWDNGTVRLVSRGPDNVPFTTESDLASPTPFDAFVIPSYDSFNAVSVDGSRIFFITPPQVFGTPVDSEIYMRENGAETHHVSESECTSSCGSPAVDRFRYATPDGEKVFFSSAERLTDDATPAGGNLYMYTHSADPASDENLTLITQDNEPADGIATTEDTSPSTALNLGVTGAGDAGDDVYFAAPGQLVAGETTESGMKLYHWQANEGNPELSFLALLKDADQLNWSGFKANLDRVVTPDGKHLLVQTPVALDPVADQNTGVPSGVPNVPAGSDVYRWTEGDGWTCISCPGTGGVNGGFFTLHGDNNPARQSDRQRHPISDDGSRVSFRSTAALVPRDTNGQEDVYQWDDGTVNLISSGKSTEPSILVGSSTDGDDVFFVTRERLVGWDTDSNGDIYDARVGGGFPEPPPSSDPCTGDECQNAPFGPPVAPGSGSGDFNGSGNVSTGARASISGVRGLSASARSTLASGGKARLRLRVNRSGKVTVVGRAKVGRKSSRVASSAAQARKAGSVSVPFALSKGARAELRRRGSLKVTLTVRFRDARPQALTFTVKSASSKRGRR